MSTLTARRAQVNRNACVVLFAPALIRRSDSFGRGVFPTRPATDVEIRARQTTETFTREEKRVADHFAITLAEARALIAEGEDALRDAEWARLRAFEEMSEAEAV